MNEAETRQGREVGGSGHQAVVLICKCSSDDAKTVTLPPVPSLRLHVHPLSVSLPDASLMSDGTQQHTAGKPGHLLVTVFFFPSASSHPLTAHTCGGFAPFVTFDRVVSICLAFQNV